MPLSIDSKELLPLLKIVNGAIETRGTLPILGNLLFRSEDDTIYFTATDSELEITCSLQTNEMYPSEEITIPARKLFDICKTLDGVINFDIDNNNIIIKNGRSKFTLQTLPAAGFPMSPTLTSTNAFTFSQGKLKNALKNTAFCMANNDVRVYLQGTLLEISDTISFVATDGHRMAATQYPNVQNLNHHRLIIPRKTVIELLKTLSSDVDDMLDILIDDNHIIFDFDDKLKFTSKLISGTFPDWNNVIPKNQEKVVIVNTLELKQSLLRTSILSSEKYKEVKFALNNGVLSIDAKNSYQEKATDELEIEYNGDELEIGFNGSYFIDAISHISTETVKLAFTDENTSCLITDQDGENSNRFIVMPMRL